MKTIKYCLLLLFGIVILSCGGGADDSTQPQVSAIPMTIAHQFDLGSIAGAAAFTWALASDGTSIYLHRQVLYPFPPDNTQDILKIDPTTGAITATYSLSSCAACWISDMTWYNGMLWVSGGGYYLGSGIFQVNLVATVASFSNGLLKGAGFAPSGGLEGVATDGTNFYVGVDISGSNSTLGMVTFEPSLNTSVPTTPYLNLGYQPKSMSYGGGYLWAISSTSFVKKIDPISGVTLQEYSHSPSYSRQGMLHFNGLLWMVQDDTKLIGYNIP